MMLVSTNGHGLEQRVVVVGLGGEVHDHVGLRDQRVDQVRVGDRPLHERIESATGARLAWLPA